MKSLSWIRLLAYQARATHERDRRGMERAALREAAALGRNMAALRSACAHDIEVRMDDETAAGDFDCTCTNSASEHGFTLRMTSGPSAGRTMSVEHVDGGVICGFQSDPQQGLGDARVVSIAFAPSALVLASPSGETPAREFQSLGGLASHLIDVLTAR